LVKENPHSSFSIIKPGQQFPNLPGAYDIKINSNGKCFAWEMKIAPTQIKLDNQITKNGIGRFDLMADLNGNTSSVVKKFISTSPIIFNNNYVIIPDDENSFEMVNEKGEKYLIVFVKNQEVVEQITITKDEKTNQTLKTDDFTDFKTKIDSELDFINSVTRFFLRGIPKNNLEGISLHVPLNATFN